MKKIFNILIMFLMFNYIGYGFRLDGIHFNQRMDGKEGGYREFYLINDTKMKQRYRVKVLPSEKNNASEYIQIYPKVITLEPKEKGIVKVFANAPNELPKKEYFFKLQFIPVTIPTLAKAKEGAIAGTSNVSIAPVVEMKGYVGEIDFSKALSLENIRIGKAEKTKDGKDGGIIVKVLIKNSSHAGIEMGAEAYLKNDFFVGADYIGEIKANEQGKEIVMKFKNIKSEKELKKIVLYRTPSYVREVLKEIDIKEN